MYLEIQRGKRIDIQGLGCWIPEPGYVFNIATKQIEKRDIYARSDIKEEQYWERIPMPIWYGEIMKKWDSYEKNKKDDDTDFYDEKLEEYKRQEWDRRLNGFWFYNNGVPTYITGSHYFYLQWWQIDIGYPKFRHPDLEYFYFLQYCIEDPNCMGMLEITKRRFGKTFRGGLFVTEYTTRTKMTNGTIQSKTGADAKKVFSKAVVNPFRRLPRFFRPEYDMSLGVNPKSEMRFEKTNVRGKKANDNVNKDELGSTIVHYSAEPLAQDGQKVHRAFQDEWAKTYECDIYDRHEVLRYCVVDDEGNIIGKILYSSTVEQLDSEKDGVQEAAIKLWNDSDQLKKRDNGRTSSGLYRFFMTADRAKNFDIFGYPNIEKTVKEILADRETVKHNQKSWAARVRKEARTIDEAFYAGNDKCEFNAENIIRHIKDCESDPAYWRKMRLVQKKWNEKSIYKGQQDIEKTSVSPMDDENGGWKILEFPNKENLIESFGDGSFAPLNKTMYQIGVDTTQDREAIDGSNPAIIVFKKSCIVNIDGQQIESGMYPVAVWDNPTRMDIHFDDEVLKACIWYGCTAAYEVDRRNDFLRFFRGKGCADFLEWTPKIMMNPVKNKAPEPGQRSGDPFQISKWYVDGDSLVEYNGHVHRIRYVPLLNQLLKYNHNDRTKSDLVVALQMALGAIFGEMKAPVMPESVVKLWPEYEIKSYF